MGIAGGFIWSLWEFFRRTNTMDLGPEELFEMAVRLVAAPVIGYAFSQLADVPKGLMAFAAAGFPLRETRHIAQRWALRQTSQNQTDDMLKGQVDLRSVVQGINEDEVVRLREIGVETVVDLAYTHPIEIIAETGFRAAPVIDWCDQALLLLYVGSAHEELAKRGIRGSIECAHFFQDHFNEIDEQTWGADKEVKELATALKMEVGSVCRLMGTLYGDPHVEVLWHLWGG